MSKVKEVWGCYRIYNRLSLNVYRSYKSVEVVAGGSGLYRLLELGPVFGFEGSGLQLYIRHKASDGAREMALDLGLGAWRLRG